MVLRSAAKLSYTLEVTIIPNPPQKQPQSIWDQFTQTVIMATQSVADFVYDNKEAILVDYPAVVAVGAAGVMTGGAAAPALAVGSDRRLKRNIKQVGILLRVYLVYFQYLDHDTLYHGVMAQKTWCPWHQALVTRGWDVCSPL